MRLVLDEHVFQSLHPFSCVVDPQGRVVLLGRSLSKLVPDLQLGDRLCDHLTLTQPAGDNCCDELESLPGELIVLAGNHSGNLKLRGHVVHLPAPSECYLFALQPTAAYSRELAESGLNFSDFALGDPVFDFILLVRQLELANERLASAVTELELDGRFSGLLCELANDLFLQESEAEIYHRCLRLVCEGLGWCFGQVVPTVTNNSEQKKKTLWYARDKDFLEHHRTNSHRIGGTNGAGISASVYMQPDVAWISEYHIPQVGIDSSTNPKESRYQVVWIPIVIAGESVAILEFFGDTSQQHSQSYMQFFDLLSHQVSQAIIHVQAHDAETKRVAAMAHAAKMATLGEIAAGVAHEIKNPVSTASLIATLLKRSVVSGAISSDLVDVQVGRLELCLQRINTIVSELQGFSRNASRDPLRHEPLQKILVETLDLCGAGFSAKKISLIYHEVPLDWRVWCRASQISQVLLNLLSNAQDAVRKCGERWVRIEISDRGENYEISVSDSGPGVPEEIRDRVMTPFFTTKEPGRGTGLGLSISANIMVDHGGLLYLDDEACHTRFVARIPKNPPPNIEIAKPPRVTSSSNV